MNQSNFPGRLQRKRDSAKERAEFRAGLSATQQLQALDDRLGAGVGARKERRRLAKAVEKK